MNKADVLSDMPVADSRNPWMGLNGLVCKRPAFWCRLHRVWLSKADADSKNCFSRMTPDMISTRKCNCIERKERNPWTGQTL